jgi:uncharacterized membrane protein YkoI
MKRRIVWTVAALVVGGALAGGAAYAVGRSNDDTPSEQRAERAFTQAHQDRAAIGRAEAEARALKARPGTVVESELEAGRSGLIWEVEIDDGSALHEVTIDATTGEVLGGEAEGAEGAEADD